jgi:hypothetical protein
MTDGGVMDRETWNGFSLFLGGKCFFLAGAMEGSGYTLVRHFLSLLFVK